MGGEIFRTCPNRPWGPPSLLYHGYRVFPGGKERPGREADTSPLLVPWSRKSRAIPLLPLWAVRPVQSLSACTVELYLYSPYGPYGLYRVSVSVQGRTLPFYLIYPLHAILSFQILIVSINKRTINETINNHLNCMRCFSHTLPIRASPTFRRVFSRLSKCYYHCDRLSSSHHRLSNLPDTRRKT